MASPFSRTLRALGADRSRIPHAIAAASGLLTIVWTFDRGFYGSSRLGATLRAPFLMAAYIGGAVVLALGLLLLATL